MPILNKTQRRAYAKKWYQKNKECILAHQKEYYQSNKDKIKIQHKIYRLNNKKQRNAYSAEWRQENKDYKEAYDYFYWKTKGKTGRLKLRQKRREKIQRFLIEFVNKRKSQNKT